jgi:hypothetical protein
MPICAMVRKARGPDKLEAHGDGGDPGHELRPEHSAEPAVRHNDLERAIGGLEQLLRNGNALLLVGVEQYGVGAG